MIPPRISELTESISIVNVTKPYDLLGRGTIVSTLASSIRAKCEPLAGGISEMTQQKQLASQPYNIWIRYIKGVTPWQQIVWGDSQLAMTAPPEVFDLRWILIHAEEQRSRKI